MNPSRRLIAVAIAGCTAYSGCYMRVKAVEDSGRLGAIEQRLAAVEQAVGLPSPAPVSAGQSDTSATIRVQSAEHFENEDARSAPSKKGLRATRLSSPARNPD
ncbi:MAG TPA: hypothetical protein VGH74_11225 [Planctomycetaceae bacterium]|jgi:hypothetical protein